jgi:hypothetical protein
MNKKRLAKSIGFLVAGTISFVPLIFLHQVLAAIGVSHFELILSILKAIFITLGIIFLATGIYNLIMLFFEEDEPTKLAI